MITIQINEKPFIEAKNGLVEVGQKALERCGELKTKVGTALKEVKKVVYVKPSKIALYASLAANGSSFLWGYFSASNLALTTITFFSLDAYVKEAKKEGTSLEEKKWTGVARANIAINGFSSLLNGLATVGKGPDATSIWAYLGLGGTLYNLASDYIEVSIKV